jgi:hypothetical protein
MLISFLAALEGGISFEDQATTRTSASRSRDREAGARVALPSLLSLLNVDMSGRMASRSQDDASEEVVAVRRHTEASLFNALRARILELGTVFEVRSSEDLAEVAPGRLVEVAGIVAGNPIQQLALLLASLAPLAGIDLQRIAEGRPQIRAGKNKPRPLVPQTETMDEDSETGIRLLIALAGETYNASVRDVVFTTGTELRAVLTLASEFVSDETEEYLKESEVRVLGKVTRVVRSADEHINLMRRTALGLAGPEQAEELVLNARNAIADTIDADISDPLVAGPAVQLLPLAIFV